MTHWHDQEHSEYLIESLRTVRDWSEIVTILIVVTERVILSLMSDYDASTAFACVFLIDNN